MERLLIIGNGMATGRLLQELCAETPCGYRITVVGDEAVPAYNRILLSRLLGREIEADSLQLHSSAWLDQHGIETITGLAVEALDLQKRVATLGNGRQVQFDRLVFATGARAVMPEIPGIEGRRVHTFRTWRDCDVLQRLGDENRRIVVAGGGLLGIEAACGLSALGAQVSVVHSGDWPLNRQLDRTAGGLLAEALRSRGIDLRLAQRCERVLRSDTGAVSGVALQDGTHIAAQALVCAIGILPNDQLASHAGLSVDHGICVNGWLETGSPGVYALGECARVSGENVGLMEPVNQQAAILAQVLRGGSPAFWQPAVTPTRLKVTGEEVFSSGMLADEKAEALAFCDPISGTYRKLLVKDQQLVGAILYGDTSDGNWYHRLIMDATPVNSFRQHLLFGRSACETAA